MFRLTGSALRSFLVSSLFNRPIVTTVVISLTHKSLNIGFKTSRIKMMKLSGFDTYLEFKSNAINAVIVIVPLRLKPLLWNLIVTFLIPLNKLFS